MSIQKIYALVAFTIISFSSFGQILKVDKGSIASDSSDYFMGSINLDFNMNNRSATASQNITYTGIDGDADLVYVGKRNAYILLNQLNYFKTTTGPLFSTGQVHFRVNFLRKNKISYELFSQIQYDQGRKMPLRLLEGGNIRIRVKESTKSKLHIGIGAMYEREHWKSLEVENMIIEKEIIKSTNYINYKQKINENVSFNMSAYYQGGYDQEEELFRNRMSGDAVITVKLTDQLAFNTSFSAQYEDKPIIAINNWVYSLTNGFKFSF